MANKATPIRFAKKGGEKLAKSSVVQMVYNLKDNVSSGIQGMKKNTLQYRRDLRDLKKAGADTFKSIAKGVTVAGVATVGLATAGIAAATKFGSVADEIDKASKRAGVGAQYLQEMRYAMDQVGISNDTLDRALKRTNQRMAMAEKGNKKYDSALKEMGVSTRNVAGEMRNAGDVFDDAINALSQMESAQDRARLAGEFFGVKTAQDLLPALEAGGDAIKNLREEAHRLGVVIEDDLVASGTRFNDGMIDLKRSVEGVFYTLATPALPLFNRGVEWLTENIIKFKGFATDAFNSLRDSLDANRDRFNKIIGGILQIKDSIMGAFGSDGEGGGAINWFINDGIPAVVGGIASVLEGAMTTYNFVKDNWSMIAPVVYGIVGALTAYHVITKAITIATYAKTAAVWAFNTALNMSPIGWVLTGIGLLIAAGTFLIKNWDDVKLASQKVWTGMVTGVEWAANLVIKGINWMVEQALLPINLLIKGLNKIPGVSIDPIEFGGFNEVDFGAAKFDTEGQEFKWGNKKEEESFEDILANFDKQQEIKVQAQQASNDNLIESLDNNTAMMSSTAGKINDVHVTLYASDLTAEEVADVLVPRIQRKVFG